MKLSLTLPACVGLPGRDGHSTAQHGCTEQSSKEAQDDSPPCQPRDDQEDRQSLQALAEALAKILRETSSASGGQDKTQ